MAVGAASHCLVVRFGSGTEIRYGPMVPEVGSTISRNGSTYVVASREQLMDGAVALNVLERETGEVVELSPS